MAGAAAEVASAAAEVAAATTAAAEMAATTTASAVTTATTASAVTTATTASPVTCPGGRGKDESGPGEREGAEKAGPAKRARSDVLTHFRDSQGPLWGVPQPSKKQAPCRAPVPPFGRPPVTAGQPAS